MAKEWAKKFYNSKVWKQCRDSYIAKVFGLCERCKNAGDILHHTIELTPLNINDTNITLNHDNLEYVCIDCHNKEHHGSEAIGEGLMFDENGDIKEKTTSF